MLQREFEELIGRKIPSEVYNKIEAEYMATEAAKEDFSKGWTAEKIDSLICKTFFEMQMGVLAINSYIQEIERYRKVLHDTQERNRILEDRNYRLSNRESDLEDEIEQLKAKLYDKVS
jgi:hypothetical protein